MYILVDIEGLTSELDGLVKRHQKRIGVAELRHAKRIDIWLRLLYGIGLGTAWIVINPLSAVLIGIAKTGTWTMLAHHVRHGAYDKIPGVPRRLHSRYFANNKRRFLDWMDWFLPAAWDFEHNRLHHYHANEYADPDLLQRNVNLLRESTQPLWFKYIMAFLLIISWKVFYFAPNTFWYFQHQHRLNPDRHRRLQELHKDCNFPGAQLYSPFSSMGWQFWQACILPYAIVNFICIPLCFLPIGPWAAFNVFVTLLLAECVTNLHSFIIITTNHSGCDIPYFESGASSKGEFYLKQMMGSVNFTSRTSGSDFLHGYLNYQIEHHLWPTLPMLTYRNLQPEVQQIARKYQIPYVQESVWIRFRHVLRLMVGTETMQAIDTTPLGDLKGRHEKVVGAVVSQPDRVDTAWGKT